MYQFSVALLQPFPLLYIVTAAWRKPCARIAKTLDTSRSASENHSHARALASPWVAAVLGSVCLALVSNESWRTEPVDTLGGTLEERMA